MVGPATISKDDLFHVLQNGRRRAIMRYLLAHPQTEQFTTRELSENVGAWEQGTTVRGLTSDERQRVYIALYQIHLPTLDERGVIEFDKDRGTVEPAALLALFDPYLGDGLHDTDDRLSLPADGDETEPTGLAGTVATFLSD